MLKASRVLSDAATAAAPSDTLTLPFELRQRSRLVASLASGRQIALTLPRGHVLRGGARLQADDGTVIGVLSAAEELSVVPSADPAALLRAAYHLGNRHVPVQVGEGFLRIAEDHVLEDLLRRLGASVMHVEAPFEPEGGAYQA